MGKNKLAVLCDFDGTVTKVDVGHQVYAHFGDERWKEVNQRWRRGEISSKDCLIGEYSFLDASEQEVMEHIMKMEIDPGLLDLVDTCRNNDIPIAIVSDGFDFYIHAMLEKYGLSDIDVFCNQMRFNGRKVELSFPFYDQGCGVCGNCKKLHVQNFEDDSRTVIYVGDGLSDRYAARASDVVFAKADLKTYLINNSIDFIEFTNMSDVNRWMVRLLAGEIDLPAKNDDGATDPCQEASHLKKNYAKQRGKCALKKLKMKKNVRDMGDSRYIVYYEWE